MTSPLYQTKLDSLEDLHRFTARLAPCLRMGDILALDGDLGAGKTELCRSLIHQLGFHEEVPSPTFNLVQTYEPPYDDQEHLSIWHMDLYRLEEPEEAWELGIEEAFDTALCLIEWPSRLGHILPDEHLHVKLEIAETQGARHLSLYGDALWADRLAHLSQP